IVPEHSPGLRGMSDFQQHGDRLSEQRVGVSYHHPALQDMAGHIRRMCDSGAVDYRIEIQFTDGSTMGSENSGIEGFYAENLPPIMQYHGKTCIQSMRIRVENLPLEKTISEIIISDRYKNQWKLSETYETEYATRYSGKPPQIEITFPIRQQAGQYLSMQLSCHDNGWTGFPHQENPFAGRGSRFRMGYGLLLAPLVPVMMSGEEFNADFTPLPTLSPDLYGGDGKNGLGRWLYGNQLGWDQLDRKRDVLEDTRRMLDIRRQHNGLIHAFRVDNPQEKLGWVRFSASAPIPVPYSYSDRKRLIVVGGNPNTATAVVLTLELPDWENATVTDLFHQQPLGTHHAGKEYTIPKDCTAGGGLLVLELCRE
nr:hypothetical protein [Candidatus Limiplasma sp.]